MSFYPNHQFRGGPPMYNRQPPPRFGGPMRGLPRGLPHMMPPMRSPYPRGRLAPSPQGSFYSSPMQPQFGPPSNFMRPPQFVPEFDPPKNGEAEVKRELEDLNNSENDHQSLSSTNSIPIIPRFSSRPQSFDPYMNDKEFWPTLPNEEAFSKALIQRNQQITPNDNEQSAITSLMTRVKSALENIAASSFMPSVKIDEFREVGSLKKGTLLTRRIAADLVVFFKTLPTPETVKQLGEGIVQLLKQGAKQPNEIFGVVPRDYGCDIAGTQAVLKIMVAIPADEFNKLDPGLHLKVEYLEKNLSALRHALWFDEHAGQPAIKILVRLIKDIKQRCNGLAALDVWTIELLSHYCVTCTPDKNALPLTHAFRRFFQLIAGGFLLHTSVGVADPCDQTRRINYGFDLAEADMICRTSQFIARLLLHEQYGRLLSVKPTHKDIGSENEAVQNLNIAPLKEAYNKNLMENNPPEDRFFSRIAV